MARDDAEGTPPYRAPQDPGDGSWIPDDALAERLEAEVARIASESRAPMAGLSDDELVEALSAGLARTGDTLETITKLQLVLAERARERAPGARHAAPSGWIAPSAFLDGPAVPGLWDRPARSLQSPTPVPPESASESPGAVPLGAPIPGGALSGPEPATEAEDGDADVVDDVVWEEGADAAPAPRATVPLGEGVRVLEDSGAREPLFRVEAAGSEPTPLEFRTARAARLFWLWFAATSSLATIGIGAALARTGMGPWQLAVALVAGLALSAVPLALGALAGKWSGVPALILSRAVYGFLGNALPSALALISRLFWAVAALWFLGTTVGQSLFRAGWVHDALPVSLGAAALALVLAAGIAVLGYRMLARAQLILSIAAAVLIAAVIVVTLPHLDPAQLPATAHPDWRAVPGGAALVFGVVGLAWANSSADLARYQRPSSSAGGTLSWSGIGAVLAPLVLVGYGAALSLSDPALGARLLTDPVGALIVSAGPAWFAAVVAVAVVAGAGSALLIALYSASFALGATGAPVGRPAGVVIGAVVVAAGGAALILARADFREVYLELAVTIAVPIAAWAGALVSEVALRRRRFHGESLVRRGGAYPDWRWANLIALVLAGVVGFGLLHERAPWLAWQGYLRAAVGLSDTGFAPAGLLVAFAIGVLVPVIFGIPGIRRSERTSK